jgi:membrane protease YdiL (CAAX protease family)
MRRAVLIATPPLLLATTWMAFQLAAALLGQGTGYLAGFLFYWIVWCGLLPLAILGPRRVAALFRSTTRPFGDQPWLGVVILGAPLALGFSYAFPRALPHATAAIIALSLLIAIVNATAEEILWRGTYAAVFRDSRLWGWLYPTLGFAVWHFAPQSVFPNPAPGGSTALVVVAGIVGLGWGWLARRTNTIRWTVLAHVAFDFSGLGARLYF